MKWKWYEAELNFSADWRERLVWCNEHFGNAGTARDQVEHLWFISKQPRWYQQFTTIYFRDSKDYEWYVLRWL